MTYKVYDNKLINGWIALLPLAMTGEKIRKIDMTIFTPARNDREKNTQD